MRPYLAHPRNLNRKSLYLLYLLAGLLLASCSTERNNPLSKGYHNTAARYNGYFLAREKMRLLQESLQEQMQYDYNQVLPIYPSIDSTTAKAFEADLEDIKKKASHPIQYHKNSKWIDNSYIEIGKANYYQLNFAEAVRTFKYVNATSKDSDDQHEALVWLMRAFMQLEEMENAKQVSEYLRKERLNKANARELYLARAHYYRLEGDTTQVIENLALSIPNFEDKDAQSRARYTLAQLYQFTNQNKEAYKLYSKILRRNPPFDLGFFSRLNLGQVTELTDEQDKERIAGYYQKMLKDEKNIEYRDRIYYEMAQFELRQKNYDKALELLQKSLKTPGALANQKGYSYVSAGEIYFDNLNKYDLSAAYYDSAVQVYPQRAPEYEAVVERRDILADFAQQYGTIQTQDSLQRLGRMSEAERLAFVQALVQREEEAQQLEMARQQELQKRTADQPARNNRRSPNGDAFGTPNSTGGVWYFDNPTAMASARAEFVRRWGDRPLQDFWRTRTRGEAGNEANIARAPVMEDLTTQLSPAERTSSQVQTYLDDIPVTTVALQRSEKLVEESLFRLANIYAQNLNDTVRAEQTYLELLRRFPNSEHTPEAYYSLYLLYGKAGNTAQQQVYYKKIKEGFPNTTFARLLDDSDFLSKNAEDNRKAQALYDEAYGFYSEQEYPKATKLLHQIISQYPLNDIKDKVAYLEAMVTARTQKPEVLQRQLQKFRKDYPASPLAPQAEQLLASYTELEQNNLLRKGAPAPPEPKKPQATASLTPEQKVSTEIALAKASAAKPKPAKQPAAAKEPQPKQPEPVKELPQQKAKETPATTPAPAQPTGAATAVPSMPTVPDTAPATPPAPPVDPLAYEVADDSAYYFVLLYPTEAAAFKDVVPKYEKYNSTYFKNDKLTIDAVAFDGGKTMLLVRAFTDPKTAVSFNVKQKAPQAPVGRIRGVDFTTFVISSANYQKFLQKKDLEAYLTFFKNNY